MGKVFGTQQAAVRTASKHSFIVGARADTPQASAANEKTREIH